MTCTRILSLIIVLSLTIGFDAQYSKRVVDRLKLLEQRVISDSSIKSHDISILYQRLDKLDQQCTKSLNDQDETDSAIEMKPDLSEYKHIDLGNGINELKLDMLLLYRAFGSEKRLNIEFRDAVQSVREGIEADEDIVRSADLQILRQSLEKELSCSKDIERVNSRIDDLQSAIVTLSDYVDEKMNSSFLKMIDIITDLKSKGPMFSSCKDALDKGYTRNNVYTMNIHSEVVQMYCDQATDGGGWTVFQRRMDGSENFDRGLEDYKIGFGNVEAEFWLGNDYISAMTAGGGHELRIDMGDLDGNTAYAIYKEFTINDERENYRLNIAGYSGNASDYLRHPNSKDFTIRTKGGDWWWYSSCNIQYTGGWWYSGCSYLNLNGLYSKTGISSHGGRNTLASVATATWL